MENLTDILDFTLVVIDRLIPVILALSILYFLIKIMKYIRALEDKEKSEARNSILYGLIILTVMVSLWGLVNILVESFFPQSFEDPMVGSKDPTDLIQPPKKQ